ARSEPGAVTELRPGVYVFNDAQQLALGSCSVEDVALTVLATVTSTAGGDRAFIDAGSKVLGADRPLWMDGHGLLPDLGGAVVEALSEHHGVVRVRDWRPAVRVGDRVRVVPNHVCATVNLVDELAVVRDGRLVGRWRVDARGRNS
ncbi:MAG: D-TA family PLP-dependent enzyme, partial [Gemmatimonadales bacterium]